MEPVKRDVLQIFGVGGKLAKELPVTFDGTQLLFSVGLFLAWEGQAVLANDTGDGVVAAGEIELMLEAFGAEAGLTAQLDDLAVYMRPGEVWWGQCLGRAGKFGQRGGFTGLITAQPLRTVLREQLNSRAAALRPCLRAKSTSF